MVTTVSTVGDGVDVSRETTFSGSRVGVSIFTNLVSTGMEVTTRTVDWFVWFESKKDARAHR
jgi:hypothetical protein